MKYDDMHKLDVHPGWDDGRQGYLWCRLDAVLDESIGLRAELTWNDNYREAPIEKVPDSAREYSDPELMLETNIWFEDHWVPYDSLVIRLWQREAEGLMRGDPKNILEEYREQINKLKVAGRA